MKSARGADQIWRSLLKGQFKAGMTEFDDMEKKARLRVQLVRRAVGQRARMHVHVSMFLNGLCCSKNLLPRLLSTVQATLEKMQREVR